jgi:hypothetical protein
VTTTDLDGKKKMVNRLLYITPLLFCSIMAQANPAHVILIRHAEKSNGRLSSKGESRAEAYVGYFTGQPMRPKVGLPTAIYAFRPQGHKHDVRGVETMTPLSDAIKIPITTTFSKKQVKALVTEIMNDPAYDDRTVLICWEHKHIPLIAAAFGVKSVPNWPKGSYDRTWVIDLDDSGNVIGFENLAQNLLPGDS